MSILHNPEATIKSKLSNYIIQNIILDYVIQNMEVTQKGKKIFLCFIWGNIRREVQEETMGRVISSLVGDYIRV